MGGEGGGVCGGGRWRGGASGGCVGGVGGLMKREGVIFFLFNVGPTHLSYAAPSGETGARVAAT